VRSVAEYGGEADAGRARAAAGTTCRQFLAPLGDWEVPKGFAKNGDTIGGYLADRETLVVRYAKKREMHRIPLKGTSNNWLFTCPQGE
jgi:hypothetical protein